ncbi:MAG TPA: DUF5916 domain-containing protein [Sphingobacteriaceae bacterium]
MKNRLLHLRPAFPVLFLLAFSFSSTSLWGQPKKVYTTARIKSSAPVIDGKIDEPTWEAVQWGDSFTQRMPVDSAAPSQQTAFKILYDDKNLYVAIRAFDTEPDKIVRRMSRRDGFEGDWVEINIDSYHDLRSSFSFTASVSGVKGDEAVSNDGNIWDASWEPIWYLQTNIDEKGWTAEFRIPLSQLRFANKEEHVWGLQVNRRLFRKEEASNWQYIPQSAPGWVHLFGELRGLKGIKPQKQLEIQPYIVANTQTFPEEDGNPFATGNLSELSGGLDGKIGITSDITLDFTVNPDFGQVEADPSEVNLTAFETFFEERRPFFIESRNILDYQITSSVAGGNYTRDNLFYSRRIGRPPHYFPITQNGEFVKQPLNSTILGALKLTGKTHNGLSFAVLESVTGNEKAEVDLQGVRRTELVEPLTNYLVARMQQDLNKGNTIIGGMFTATNRNITEPYLNFLARSAYTAGIDFQHNWKDREYYISGNAVLSRINGSTEAITAAQRSSLRYFQRPSAPHVGIDSSKTSLTGTGATFKGGKKGKGNIQYESGITFRSPELELNDVGFQRSADQINWWSWIGYRTLKPFGIFRQLNVNANAWSDWDFSGTSTYKAANTNFNSQFKNYWRVGAGATPNFGSVSNADLRGGPAIRYPGGISYWYWFETDNRKKLRFYFEHNNYHGSKQYQRSQDFYSSITYRPVNALVISASPTYSIYKHALQYISSHQFSGDQRLVTALLSQRTLSATVRIDYTITPNLSVQYYGQPFASKGSYRDFKRIIDGRAAKYEDRFSPFSANQIQYNTSDNSYTIDENLDGFTDYTLGNPNFTFMQYRSNLVVRWEYVPGSTVFIVWSQSRTGDNGVDRFSVSEIGKNLFDIKAHNVFLVKFTYRLVL